MNILDEAQRILNEAKTLETAIKSREAELTTLSKSTNLQLVARSICEDKISVVIHNDINIERVRAIALDEIKTIIDELKERRAKLTLPTI